MIIFVFALAVVLPLAWFISEFQANRMIRLALGTGALAISFWIAWAVGKLDRLNSNSYFGSATKDLVQNTIEQLEQGNTEEVLRGMRALRAEFEPSYETRDDYDRLVTRYIESIAVQPTVHEIGRPGWSHEHE